MNATYKCCKNNDINCYDNNIYKVRDYINLIDIKMSEISCNNLQLSSWGYSHREYKDNSLKKLKLFKFFLGTVYSYLSKGIEPPFKDMEVQKVLESVSFLVDTDRADNIRSLRVKEDKSRQDEYLVLNPGCQPYEVWERALIKVCHEIGFTIKDKSSACKISYDILISSIEDNCKLFYTIDIINKAKAQNCFDINITNLASCKNDYNILINNIKCDLSYEVYIQILKCNVSSKALENILSNNYGVSVEDNEVLLHKNGNSFKLSDITIKNVKGVNSMTFNRVINDGTTDTLEIVNTLKNSYNNLDC